MNTRFRRFVASGAVVGVIVACRPGAPAATPEPECAPPAENLPSGVRADRLAGTYRLTLVADEGPYAGRSVSGQLTLMAFDTAAPYAAPSTDAPGGGATYPLHGRTDVALESLGAPAPGADTADPELPGVLVVAWEDATGANITLRFGSEANRPGMVRIDGAFTALHVSNVTDTSFAGGWLTGGAQASGGGHFCAWRQARASS